ncbi:MAG: PAS domain S-box protein, partial [Chitinophagaceae bacterium]
DEIINSQTKELYEMELRIVRDDGTIGHIEDRGYVIRNGEGKALRIIGATLDITERKIAEEKVLLRKQRYKSLVQNSTDLLGVLDAEGNYLYVSGSSKNILGIEPGFFIGKNAFSFIHEDDQEKVLASLQEVLSGKFVETPLFRFKNNAGEWRWIESRVTNLLNDPAVEGIVMNSRDVTDKKVADEKLQFSEQRFKSLVQNATDLLTVINAEGNFIYVSPSSKKILGIEASFFIGKNAFTFIHEDDQQIAFAALQEVLSGNFEEITQYRFKNGTGEWRWVESTGINLLNDPAVGGIVVNARDVTDKKNSDDKLLLSEKRFKSLVQNSTDLLSIINPEGIYKYVSPTSKKILGYDPEFLVGKNGFTFVHEDDRQKMMDFFVANADKKFVETPLFRFKNSAGEWRWIEGSITNMLDDPAVGGIVINSRDVTEKKIADDQLSNLSLIAKETINGVMILDDQYKVTWVNTAFTKMSGYELIEISGKSPFEFFPAPETNVTQMGFINNQLSYKEPFVFEKLDKTKTGDKLFMKVQMQPTFTENGAVKQYIAIITDVTKQKELEEQVELEKLIKQKEITQAVFTAQENERSHIGRELHDNVNQLLGATHLYIDMSRKNQKDRDSLLDSASTYTYNAIQEIRKLSKTLITPLIKDVGLIDSIKYLTEEIMLVHPIKIVSNTNDYLEEGLSQQFKLNIFRIVQEQINNILKHAKAKNIVITISENAGKVLFSIADDGIGFDVGKRKPGIGITNIKSRCELHNCTLKLSSQPGKGTTLSISFNKKDLIKDNAYETIS